MRSFTMPGVAPDPNWRRLMNTWGPIDPDPVFPLTRKHDLAALNGFREATPGFTFVPTYPQVQNLSTRQPAREESRRRAPVLDEDAPMVVRTSRRPVVARANRRRAVVRFAGLFVVTAALFGSGLVLRDPVAGREALSWATLGHADVVLSAVHRLPLLGS
jgi:hypothetical protein